MNINPEFERILGRTSRDLADIKWPEITHPEDLSADLEKFALFKAGKIQGYSMEKRFLRPDGSGIWTYMTVSPLLGSPFQHSIHLCLLIDISMRKETEESLRESERSKSVLLSNLPGMAYRCDYDRDWTMQIISEGCYELTGYPPECLIQNRDLSYNDIITPEYRETLWQEWERDLSGRKPFKYEYEITTAGGERKWVLELGEGVYDENGRVTALEGIVLDISDRKKMENELRFSSEHDSLTGLMNRRSLEYALTNDAAAQLPENRAVVGINLSTIHSLSMRYGFHYSHALIKRIADALALYSSDNRRLFSTYEYQFAFYLKAYKDAAELTSFCESVAGTIEAILSIERVGGGIGVVEIGEGRTPDAEQLLKNLLITSEKAVSTLETDIGICFFNKEMEEKITREEMISRELTQIAAGERADRLFLQYQPILDIPTNQICGFEALARMRSRNPRLVPPLEFIPIAEKTKLIVPLGDIILQNALRFLKTLEENGHATTTVSVNVSAIQLLRKGFVDRLDGMIRGMPVNPNNVTLEITESVFASNYEEINETLGELRELGLDIAIDDFGTGYSSFARQRELHADCLKIDKYFMDKLLDLDPEKAIIGDIISFGHKLGHCIVAEGVEYEKQLQYLRERGCDKAQGYLIGKPLDEGAALALLGERVSSPSSPGKEAEAQNIPYSLF
jgi:PAS domain S-box-containing protein